MPLVFDSGLNGDVLIPDVLDKIQNGAGVISGFA